MLLYRLWKVTEMLIHRYMEAIVDKNKASSRLIDRILLQYVLNLILALHFYESKTFGKSLKKLLPPAVVTATCCFITYLCQ